MIIIAEAGINHNGSIELAKKLALESKIAGADVVKFQTFWNLGRLKEYELTDWEFMELKRYCDEIGIEFMSTPHTTNAISFVNILVKTHKIASPFLTDMSYIKRIIEYDKPILLSTGSLIEENRMAQLDTIKKTLNFIESHNMLHNVTLLHCVSKYPCSDAHLERIEKLKRFDLPVGFSDHTKDIYIDTDVPVLEKHIMLHDVESIDEPVSLYPEEFEKMVKYIRRQE